MSMLFIKIKKLVANGLSPTSRQRVVSNYPVVDNTEVMIDLIVTS